MGDPKQTTDHRLSTKIPLVGATIVALMTFGVLLHRSSDGAKTPVGDGANVSSHETVWGSASDGSLGSGQSDSGVLSDSIQSRLARARFYDQSVVPLIQRTSADNRVAADRCIERLDKVIGGYHNGVDLFVKDMTSISTRLGILKRMPGGWWASDTRVEGYVHEKFETHLFSQQSLIDDVSAVLLQFRADVDANQRRMLVNVRAALTLSDLPEVELSSQEQFFKELSVQMDSYATEQGMTSVENMVGALVLGEVGAFAARSLIGGLLARFAPSVAISTAAGASATVGASATGAGGGSLGGPVGTVVGFGAGLAVGLIIDWWMTERFEAELSGQMHTYLDDLRQTLVVGGGGKQGEQAMGLEIALPRLCDQLTQAYRDRFFEQIVDGDSP